MSDAVKILVSDKLAPQGLEILEAAEGFVVHHEPGLSREDLLARIGEYDGLVIRSGTKVTEEVLAEVRKREEIAVAQIEAACRQHKGDIAGLILQDRGEDNQIASFDLLV